MQNAAAAVVQAAQCKGPGECTQPSSSFTTVAPFYYVSKTISFTYRLQYPLHCGGDVHLMKCKRCQSLSLPRLTEINFMLGTWREIDPVEQC